MFPRCTTCGQLPSQPIDGGVRLLCRCGKTSVEFRPPIDVDALKRLAVAALQRARVHVYAVPVLGRPGTFTIDVERDARDDTGLREDEAQRYVDAINGEAELARVMLPLLSELEELRRFRHEHGVRHGSGTMPRVAAAESDEDEDEDEEKAG